MDSFAQDPFASRRCVVDRLARTGRWALTISDGATASDLAAAAAQLPSAATVVGEQLWSDAATTTLYFQAEPGAGVPVAAGARGPRSDAFHAAATVPTDGDTGWTPDVVAFLDDLRTRADAGERLPGSPPFPLPRHTRLPGDGGTRQALATVRSRRARPAHYRRAGHQQECNCCADTISKGR